jgi:hypothetical protein
MQFDTLRLRLIKIAARVVELKTQLKIHLPSSAPTRRSSPCSSPAYRASSPESRGVCPQNSSAPLQPPAPTQSRLDRPAAAATIPHACRRRLQPKRD